MLSTFDDELRQLGPHTNHRREFTLSQARRYCRKLATSHYENFPVVSWLLPRRLHQHFYNVYAYCRWADDLGDEVEDTNRALFLLNWWRGLLHQCYAGSATHPVFIALQHTIETFRIPPEPFEDLISAFEQDHQVLEYETFPQLLDYCRRSANPVGRLVLSLCEQHSDKNVFWSDSICTGLQLANFWQDVQRDHDIGRIYLPQEDRDKFGYTNEQLREHVTNSAFVDLMRFEAQRAREFLVGGLPLIERMPGILQIDIELFARGGLKVLEKIERCGFDVWETRPVVTKIDISKLVLKCAARSCLRSLGLSTSASTMTETDCSPRQPKPTL